jgi:hypothetical protein
MRNFALLPLLMLAACNVSTDSRNDQVTVGFNDVGIENAADAVANDAEQAASDIGNTVEGAGQRIENQVDNLDIDVDVGRNEQHNSH